MTLSNLIGMSIEPITPDPDMINRLIAAAERNIADYKIQAVSAENRFDSAYKAIMQIANAALQKQGYRTLTSKPGHHQTMIQLLSKTLNVENKTLIILDACVNNAMLQTILVISYQKMQRRIVFYTLKNY